MKNFILIIASIFSVFLMISCKKSVPVSNSVATNDVGKDKAQWTFDGASSSSDSSYVIRSLNRIMGYKDFDSRAKTFTLNLSSLAVGTYSLAFAPPNFLTYVVAMTVDHNSVSGTVNITANTGTKLSGNFNALMDNGLTFSGSFAEIPIRP